MRFSEKWIPLRDGRTALLRAPRPDKAEAEETVEYLRTASGETEFLSFYPEELPFTPESEQKYLQTNLDAPNTMMIVCEVDGKMAGNCQLVFFTKQKEAHRAVVMIALLREFWNLGIGSAMFSEMIAAAREKNVEQLELCYVEGNERAAALYRRMGFEVMAVHPDAFRLKDGSMRSEVFMRRKL